MCFLFHKWSKWSPLVKENWKESLIYKPTRTIIYETPKVRTKQERTCQRCGKYQVVYNDME